MLVCLSLSLLHARNILFRNIYFLFSLSEPATALCLRSALLFDSSASMRRSTSVDWRTDARPFLLKHQRGQIALENGVFDGIEDDLNVLCVNCVGEMVINGRTIVSPNVHEHLQYEILYVQY